MKKQIIPLFLLFLLIPSIIVGQTNDRFTQLENEIENTSFLERAKSFELIEEMYNIADSSPDSLNLLCRTLYSEALLRERQAMGSDLLIERVQELLKQKNISQKNEIILSSVMKQFYFSRGDYADVFTTSLDILDKAKQQNDSLWVARTFNTLGIIANLVDLYSLSIEYYNDALKWAEGSTNEFIKHSINSNLWYIKLKSSDRDAIPALLDSMQYFLEDLERDNKKGMLMINYMNTSNFWSNVDNKELSLEYLAKAQKLCVDNPYYESFILNNFGLHFFYSEEYDLALDYYKKAEEGLKQSSNLGFLETVYQNISEALEKQHKPDSALYYVRQSEKIQAQNNTSWHIMEILRRYMLTSLESSENKLALAESEIQVKDKQFIITMLLAASLLLVAIMIAIIYIGKRKRLRQDMLLKEAEAKELSIRLEKEQAIQKVQADQLADKLRELTAHSLLLSKKNEALKEIYNIAKSLPNTEEVIEKEIKKIVEENIQTENSWNDFILHFEKVHPRFFGAIKEVSSEITQTELKLAAYIRLGLSIKQIAQMTNVAPQSVKMSRHRLRKKLTLDSDQNLDAFIQSL